MCLWIPISTIRLELAIRPALANSNRLEHLERRIAAERFRAHLLRDAPLLLFTAVVSRREGSC